MADKSNFFDFMPGVSDELQQKTDDLWQQILARQNSSSNVPELGNSQQFDPLMKQIMAGIPTPQNPQPNTPPSLLLSPMAAPQDKPNIPTQQIADTSVIQPRATQQAISKRQEPIIPLPQKLDQSEALPLNTKIEGQSVQLPDLPQPVTTPGLPDVDQELLDAQEARRNNMFLLSLIRGANTIGSSIAGVRPRENYLSNLEGLASEPMTSLQERRASEKEKKAAARQAKLDERDEKKFAQDQEKFQIEMEKLRNSMSDERDRRDPNSIASKAAQEFQRQRFETLNKTTNGAIKYNPNMFDNMNVEQLENAFGKFSPENMASAIIGNERAKEEARLRREESALRREELSQNQRENRELRERNFNQNQVERYTNMVQKSDPFKDSEKILTNSARVKDLVKDAVTKGGQSTVMLGTAVAKGIAGEVGVLTDKDVTRYVQNPSLAGSLVDTIKKLKEGKLSQVSADNLLRLVGIMEMKARENRQEAYRRGATQLSRNSSLPYEKALELLDPNFVPGDEAIAPRDQRRQQEYSPSEEAGIAAVMAKNPGATREQVIKALKQEGKIK